MIIPKTEREIEIMKEGGRKLALILKEIIRKAKPGVTTVSLEKQAELLIKRQGGEPSFKKVPGYQWATCMCVNDCVVHGIPSNYQLKNEDVLGIDIGMYYQGLHTDMARTVRIRDSKSKKKKKETEIDRFLKVGRIALKKASQAARAGNRVGDISKAIQETIEEAGFSVVRVLVGHGVGRKLHEPPQIPCFLKGKIEETPLLKEGATLAIEVIYNLGNEEVVYKNNDGWTIVTRDGKLSGLFEDTILVAKEQPIILTKVD